jgi:hypothetical protein
MSTTTEKINTAEQAITAWAEQHGATLYFQFVPLSASRNKDEKLPTLNWLITLKRNGRDVLTFDYSAGSAHCPTYKASVAELGGPRCLLRDSAIRSECETGKRVKVVGGDQFLSGAAIPAPSVADVLYCLASDYSVIDVGGFESWASEFGYDTDSRKAEGIYRACLEQALALRGAFGDAAMSALQEAAQDY